MSNWLQDFGFEYRNYFSGAKHITIPGRMFPVREIYLEDMLTDLKYSSAAMQKLKRSGGAAAIASSREAVLAQLTQSINLQV